MHEIVAVEMRQGDKMEIKQLAAKTKNSGKNTNSQLYYSSCANWTENLKAVKTLNKKIHTTTLKIFQMTNQYSNQNFKKVFNFVELSIYIVALKFSHENNFTQRWAN